MGDAVGEVGGAVQGVDDPEMVGLEVGRAVGFLAEDGVVGESALRMTAAMACSASTSASETRLKASLLRMVTPWSK